ncbi:MAG: hypothetical protein H6Q25_969 [Bacteroidetes bacterium]|nr:hypothetical protein [Bacteroidota bacterium]
MRKIVNIIVFTIAGIACVLGLVFSVSFDDASKVTYFAANKVKESNPEMIKDVKSLKVETLPDFVKKYDAQINESNAELKKESLQRDIFYTYITSLKEIKDNQGKFDAYVAAFPEYSAKLFKEAKNSAYYTDGFAKIKTIQDLPAYIKTLESDYTVLKQEYLLQNENIKAATSVLNKIQEINSFNSKNKKELDLKSYIVSISDYTTQSFYIDYSIYFSYIVFFLTLGLLVVFFIYQMVKNFKSNIGGILGLLAIVIVAVIGYFVSSGELTDKAVELQVSSSLMKWVGSGLIVFYVIFFGTLLMIVGSMIMNTIKKYR